MKRNSHVRAALSGQVVYPATPGRAAFRKAAIACALIVLGSAAVARPGDVRPSVVSCKLIRTAAQLQAINKNAATKAATYCLGADIDLAGVTWTPIGDGSAMPGSAFNGQFYGNGHVIKNLTITASSDGYYGVFGAVAGGTIRDVGVVNVNINVTPPGGGGAGALLGGAVASTSPIFISNVYSTGTVACTTGSCAAGGLIGGAGNNVTLIDAWSSADVSGRGFVGGLLGQLASGPSNYQRLYATGNVAGGSSTEVGGLVGEYSGFNSGATYMTQVYATGKVTGGTSADVGGLIGKMITNGVFLFNGYATGAVSGGTSATVGGLIGVQSDGLVTQVFSTGPVSGGSVIGGLIGSTTGSPTIQNAYWDTVTSGTATSAGGVGRTTAQLRANLPAGFKVGWGITKNLSYPYLNDPDNFVSTLATLNLSGALFAFLPIGQLDSSQYAGASTHANNASLAAVYTMIARAVGITDNVATLKNVKIDTYFWNNATQKATFTGPVTSHATLGAMTNIAAATPLNGTNVIGQMNAQHLVILRGSYTKGNGLKATHYMLGTLYTKSGALVSTVVANDPWTGTQVEISPKTKKVVTPGFPLTNFTVDGYQTVTTLN